MCQSASFSAAASTPALCLNSRMSSGSRSSPPSPSASRTRILTKLPQPASGRAVSAPITTKCSSPRQIAANWIEPFFAALDQPTVDGFNTYCVSKLAADHGYRVVLSGLGGDELFGGYPLVPIHHPASPPRSGDRADPENHFVSRTPGRKADLQRPAASPCRLLAGRAGAFPRLRDGPLHLQPGRARPHRQRPHGRGVAGTTRSANRSAGPRRAQWGRPPRVHAISAQPTFA